MKAILLRINTQQRQNVFVQLHLVTLNSSQNSSKGGLTREMFFNTRREFRVSARPRNMLYLFLE